MDQEQFIYRVEEMLSELRRLDSTFQVFGSLKHQYKFNPVLTEKAVLEFEERHKISLPADYRSFILRMGDGGCGPYYGLLNLEQGIYDLPQNKGQSDFINLSKPFRFDTFWNLEEQSEDYEKWEEEYDLVKWIDGSIRIAHIGSGALMNLIVEGEEKGNVWVDDRCNEGGIYPVGYHGGSHETSFSKWYLNWLEQSLVEIKSFH